MKFKAYLVAATIAAFLCLSGCSVVQTLGDYVAENPVFASVATRQAVARYISAADTPEAQAERAKDVERRINKVTAFLDGNPTTTIDALMDAIDLAIDWDEMQPADRILVEDIVFLVEAELRQYEVENSPIEETALIAIRGLFEVAISAAQIYLLKV